MYTDKGDMKEQIGKTYHSVQGPNMPITSKN
jgi:hypothetical protein